MGMNRYFWICWLPLQVLTAVAVGFAFNGLSVDWLTVFLIWFFIGPVGIGVGFHRLFSHRSFETYRPVEVGLAVLGTLAGYSSLATWISTHLYHHTHADKFEDPSSPSHGFWESFLFHRLRTSMNKKVSTLNHPFQRIYSDHTLRSISESSDILILWAVFFTLALSPSLCAAYLFAIAIEHFRINVVNYLCHIKIPGSYVNFKTSDMSYNHWLLGILTFGFAFHNNHHADDRASNVQVQWYELDIEGLICDALTKK
jgi:fatty-acid desaturase